MAIRRSHRFDDRASRSNTVGPSRDSRGAPPKNRPTNQPGPNCSQTWSAEDKTDAAAGVLPAPTVGGGQPKSTTRSTVLRATGSEATGRCPQAKYQRTAWPPAFGPEQQHPETGPLPRIGPGPVLKNRANTAAFTTDAQARKAPATSLESNQRSPFPILNFTRRRGGINTGVPVRGLRAGLLFRMTT
jgi:hypothetical protein